MSVPSNKPSGPAVVNRGQQASRFIPRAGLTSGLPAARRAGPLFYFWNSTKNHLGPCTIFQTIFHCRVQLFSLSVSTWNTSINIFRFDRLPFVRPFLSCYLHRMVTDRLTAFSYSFLICYVHHWQVTDRSSFLRSFLRFERICLFFIIIIIIKKTHQVEVSCENKRKSFFCRNNFSTAGRLNLSTHLNFVVAWCSNPFQFCCGLVFQPITVFVVAWCSDPFEFCSGLVFQPIPVFVVAWCSQPI